MPQGTWVLAIPILATWKLTTLRLCRNEFAYYVHTQNNQPSIHGPLPNCFVPPDLSRASQLELRG